jgi:hypothetical protein
LIWGRSEQEIDTVVPAEALVFEEGSGVPAEVFFGAELGGIDKNGCDDGAFTSGDGAGVIKKRGVPPVQCAHGWNKDAEPGCGRAELMGLGSGADGVQRLNR